MKRILFSAALVGLSLTLFSPAVSFAGGKGLVGKRVTEYNTNKDNKHDNKGPEKPKNHTDGQPTTPTNNHQVPEPGTLALLGAAAGAMYLKRKRTQAQD